MLRKIFILYLFGFILISTFGDSSDTEKLKDYCDKEINSMMPLKEEEVMKLSSYYSLDQYRCFFKLKKYSGLKEVSFFSENKFDFENELKILSKFNENELKENSVNYTSYYHYQEFSHIYNLKELVLSHSRSLVIDLPQNKLLNEISILLPSIKKIQNKKDLNLYFVFFEKLDDLDKIENILNVKTELNAFVFLPAINLISQFSEVQKNQFYLKIVEIIFSFFKNKKYVILMDENLNQVKIEQVNYKLISLMNFAYSKNLNTLDKILNQFDKMCSINPLKWEEKIISNYPQIKKNINSENCFKENK